MSELLIYTPTQTNRVLYTFQFIFTEILITDYHITSDKDEFFRYEGPVLNYSHQPLGKGMWIQSHPIMLETGISKVDVKPSKWNQLPVLFTCGPGPDLPFDPIAGSFFLISRYEEYLDFTPDELGRFPASQSVAAKNDFLEVPIVDLWAHKLRQILTIRFPDLKFKQRNFRFLSTIDVDQAWAFRHKSIFRKLGGGIKSLVKAEFQDFKWRLSTLMLGKADPFDTYKYIEEAHSSIDYMYFFQVGKYGPKDKNLPGKHPRMEALIQSLKSRVEIGLHPSIRSARFKELENELTVLQDILGAEVKKSRQHYILLKFPKTYRQLIRIGIKEDYSMGFPDAPGFRAGTASPFYFYDLPNDKITDLKLYPFQVMDSCLNRTMGLPPEDALKKIRSLYDACRAVNGQFISIWHNSSLGEDREWKGWKKVFEEMLGMNND